LCGERGVNLEPRPWSDKVARFHASLEALDTFLASDTSVHASLSMRHCPYASVHVPLERVFQGLIVDAIWHAGQLAMLYSSGTNP
jgi:hypothetical protein